MSGYKIRNLSARVREDGAAYDATLDDVFVLSSRLKELPRMEWLVEGLIPRCRSGLLGVIWGEPESFKSFFTLSLSWSIGAGLPFLGKRTEAGVVLYVAAEGQADINDRADAWSAYHETPLPDATRFYFDRVDLLRPAGVNWLTTKIDQHIGTDPALIVFDTLAWCMAGGDENSFEHMSAAMDSLARLKKRYGATVLVVHHSDKRGGRIRGHSSLRAAMEFEYRLERRGSGPHCTLICEKVRGSAHPADIGLTTHKVNTNDRRSLVIDLATHDGMPLPRPRPATRPAQPPAIPTKAPTAQERVADYLRTLDARPPLKEIAAALGLPLPTVKSAVRRLA